MNITVLSPKNRGVGVTTVAYALSIELKNRGEFVQLLDVNANRTTLLNMCKDIPKYKGRPFDGMSKLVQLVRTGTISAEDMSNCAEDLGVDVIPITSTITDNEMMDIITITKNCQISGRNLYTVIDLSIEDSTSELFKTIIKNSDVCVFVMTQDSDTIANIALSKQLNDKSLRAHNIHTAYVVNRYEDCAISLSDIWKKLDIKDTKCWFKVRYNEHIMQVKSKGLYLQFAKALKEVADTDIAKVKTDIARIANYVLHKR